MSDPIRSISQNNYLLSAQQEVSHDNTLSGNGTEASPLGLNETVLYDDTVKASISNTEIFPMSESIWNFERLRLTFDNMEFTNRLLFMDIDLAKCTTSTLFRTPWDSGEDPLGLNIVWARFKINSSGNIEYIKKGLIYGTWGNPQQTTGNSRGLCLIRAVGINRKPSA